MTINKVGILYHPLAQATQSKARQIGKFIKSRGVDSWTCSAWEIERARRLLNGTDLIITTGGDGTLLRAAQVTLETGTPITGVNMGNLGFLTELKASEVESQIPRLLEGKGWLDERAMLEAELVKSGKEGQSGGIFQALNDVVIARGPVVKLIEIKTRINRKALTSYRGDGVILATATGCTGYSLAAGGPILYPQSADLILTPIVSHLGLGYSLVLAPDSVVELELHSFSTATLSVDGQVNIPISDGAVARVRTSACKTRFLRLHPRHQFFAVLEDKLRGNK
jgi:NAD+ kinase